MKSKGIRHATKKNAQQFWLKNVDGREYLAYSGVDAEIILKWY
jgi:hypothetical protein